MLDKVVSVLSELRLSPVAEETQIHEAISKMLERANIGFEHEVKLGPRNRIDFVAEGGVGIEVKKGKPNSGRVQKQVERYCAFDKISSLILVVERSVFRHIDESNGKPVKYLALNKLWGIAL